MLRYPFILFDWGDTIMKDSPDSTTPMYQWETVEAVAGAEGVLRRLHAGRTIVLATSAALSGEDDIRRALARVHLDSYFDKIYCFKNTGLKKCSPEFYLRILRDLGARPSHVLMVGDSFENDVLAANHAGIAAVWFNPRSADSRAGAQYQTIHALDELLALLTETTGGKTVSHSA